MSNDDPTQTPIPRTAEAVERLLSSIRTDADLARLVTGVRLDETAVGKRAPYFRATLTGTGAEAVLKPNLSRYEIAWSVALAALDPPLAPRVIAHGDAIAGQPVRWLLQERLVPHHPVADPVPSLALAGARFQLAARTIEAPCAEPFDATAVRRWIADAADLAMPGPVDHLLARFEADWALVDGAAETVTIHGDLHPGNVLLDEAGGLLLIGMHPIRVPWVFEAAWFEAHHLFNEPAMPRLHLIEAMERARIGLGLSPIRHDHAATCAIVRGWHAAELWLKQDAARHSDAVRQRAVAEVVEAAART